MIDRYGVEAVGYWEHYLDDEGDYVLYEDHLAAVANAEQRLDEAWERLSAERIAQAVRDERARIRKAVAALPIITIGLCDKRRALAALDALKEKP